MNLLHALDLLIILLFFKRRKAVNKEQKREKLISLLKNVPGYMTKRLNELKAECIGLERNDFIWHYILQSFSTMGNSRGHAGLILNKNNYNQVTFEAVKDLNPESRLAHFDSILRRAGVRMPRQKAQWLNTNYEKIVAFGGLKETKKIALEQNGTQAKIDFMTKFSGIGEKYARNIWLDVYHLDFHNNVAIDDRIKKVTQSLGYNFDNYRQHEEFYLSIAKEAGLNGWELDRLLYNYNDHFLRGISSV
jgi:hypothetical protein